MNGVSETIVQIGVVGGVILVGVGMLLTLIRLVRGPSRADRVVALDLLTILSVALIACLAVATGSDALLDVAIALALVAFLGTVALAKAIDKRSPGGEGA